MPNNDCNKMPGVTQVMWLTSEQVTPNLIGKFVAGIPVALGSLGTPVKIFSGAQAQCVTHYENNGVSEEATLEFRTTEKVPTEENILWAFKDATEQWWVIGARERNFPVVEVSTSTGTPGGDPAVSTVKVTHTALKAMIPVAI